MKPTLPLALLGALLASAAVPAAARAGDPVAEAAAALKERWNDGLETKEAAEVDRHRATLLEPLEASASVEALAAILSVARERATQVESFRERLKKIAEAEKKRAEDLEDGEKRPGLGAADVKEIERLLKQEEEDKARIPGRIEREERWQPRLAQAFAKVLDALSEPDFEKQSAPRVREALGDAAKEWNGWLSLALGNSRRERTARLLLDAAQGALGEYRKALAGRLKPAAELDRVNDSINKRVLKYLEERQKLGDFSASVPQGLIAEGDLKDRNRLEVEVGRFTALMEAADFRRRAAARGLGALLAGSPEEVRGKVLDVVEKEVAGAKDFEARALALLALGPCPGDRAMQILRGAAKDPAPEVIVGALEALGGRAEAEALDLLLEGLGDARWQVRAAAAAGIASYGRALGVPHLIGALGKAEGRQVDDIRDALVRLTGRKFPPSAEAWQAWWAKDGEKFRGPKDPGYEPGAAEAGEGGPDSSVGGHRVSFYGIETRTERMLFVLDFSGSMNFEGSQVDKARKKIDVLHDEMKRTLAGLADGAKFNMIGFSSDVRPWKKGVVVRDAKTAKDALEWVEKQKVVGSTNIYDALETAFKVMGVGAAADKRYEPVFDTIFFMTDGYPTSGKVTDREQILGEVKRWNEGRKIRIHVVGMGGKARGRAGPGGGPGGRGDDIDKDFLQKLAEQNDGQVVFR
jgi:hypothetical protein